VTINITVEAKEFFLSEHILELYLLLFIWLEIDHGEYLAQTLIVDFLIDCVKVENLAEIFAVHVLDTSSFLGSC
jgi:hypothetical protein